jgi:hypothetical protein
LLWKLKEPEAVDAAPLRLSSDWAPPPPVRSIRVTAPRKYLLPLIESSEV